MKKYIQDKLNSEVEHILNLQSLVTLYDRQNSYLNKQIVNLLKQNKSLKIDSIKNNIINRYPSKILERETQVTQCTMKRNSSKKNVNKYRYQTQVSANSQISKKDQQVQVSDFTVETSDLKTDKKQDNAKIITKDPISSVQDIEAFSFGQNTQRQADSKNARLQTNHLDTEQTMKKSQSKQILINPFISNEKQKQLKQPTKRSHSINFQYIKLKTLPKEEEPPNKLIKQKREVSIAFNQRPRQSHHLINQSPQIIPSRSEKSLMKTSSVIIKNKLESQQSIYLGNQYQSTQKRKKFISIMSTKLSVFPLKTEGAVRYCC